MTRHLIVANQTLAGRHLFREVQRRIDRGEARFHVVVPATPTHEHLTWTEGEAEAVASERLERALAELAEMGADASGEVGVARPIDAIRDALRKAEFDEIILSTLPAGPSRWLRADLPSRVERTFGLPVTHLIAEPESAG